VVMQSQSAKGRGEEGSCTFDCLTKCGDAERIANRPLSEGCHSSDLLTGSPSPTQNPGQCRPVTRGIPTSRRYFRYLWTTVGQPYLFVGTGRLNVAHFYACSVLEHHNYIGTVVNNSM